MLRHWRAWPRGIRWLAGGTAAVVVALAVAWVLFVPAADWLAHHDVGSVKGSLHETALDNARGRLLTLGAGLFAAGALVFTARNFTLSRRTVELTRQTFELTEQGQVTDRYTKAIEQLGSEKLDVRIGGIYALERVARDSARDHVTVMEVLTAFIREHSHELWLPPGPDMPEQARPTRPDVQAAVTVVGRREAKRDIGRINLARADLTGADLTQADLRDAFLHSAFLSGAKLNFATLDSAFLRDADLTHANLRGADLRSADLRGANLTGANLGAANPAVPSFLDGANFTGANLTDVSWHGDAPVPSGWKLDAGSGRLVAAGTRRVSRRDIDSDS